MTHETIALVSPWPPDHSGIADFARDLALGIVEAGCSVHVFTRAVGAVPCPGVSVTTVPEDWSGKELARYRHRLYQIGNHVAYHGWMLAAMTNHPGVVQVHDIVLHHLLAGVTYGLDDKIDYLRAVRDWYGEEVAVRAEASLQRGASLFWDTSDVVDFPFFEIVLEHAGAIVVHSAYAENQIARALPRIPMRRVWQTYRHGAAVPRRELARIGIFGGVQENKKLDWIVEAFGYLGTSLRGIEVTVVGGVSAQCEYLVEQAQSLEHLSVRFVGRVDEADFIAELERTDLCIALRYPTMGETSAIVMRALQLAIPTVVSDTGWYAELPAEVLKAPLKNTPHFLSSMIHHLIDEPRAYVEWAASCSRLTASLDLSHAGMCADIVDFLMSFRAERYASDLLASKLVELGLQGDVPEHELLATIEPRVRI